MKSVRELFGHAVQRCSTLEDLMVQEVKFSKKQNAAIVNIVVDRKINPLDIAELEERALQVFTLKSFKVIPILSTKDIEVTERDINNVISFCAKREEYMVPMLAGNKMTVQDSNIIIELKTAQSSFLKLKKLDEKISNVIRTIYGKNFTVTIVDSKEAREKRAEELKERNREVKLEYTKTETKSKEDESKEELLVTPAYQEQKPPILESTTPQKENLNEQILEDSTTKNEKVIYGRDISREEITKVENLITDIPRVCIDGKIITMDTRELKSGKTLLMIDVSDKTSTISCKAFLDEKRKDEVLSRIKAGNYVRVCGKSQIDSFSNELTVMVNGIMESDAPPTRKDLAEEKRVELHMHTQMSSMDGVTSATDIVNQAIAWGHKAVAITDHGAVQAFPEAHLAAYDFKSGEYKIKVLYGMEGYLVPDVVPNLETQDTFVVFDIETTGFEPGLDKITEIAAVKVKNGEFIEEYTTFVNPERPIPKNVQELTHITTDMVKNERPIEEVLPEFLEFCKGAVMVAHNAKFDMSFINHFAEKEKLEKPKFAVDTLAIAREIFESYQNHKLGTIAENLGIELEGAHRAINDTRATAKVFVKMCEILKEKDMDIMGFVQDADKLDYKKGQANHVIIFAKDLVGLKNLYKIVSYSNLHYFYRKPRVNRSMINRYRKGLIIGSACERGELYQAILNKAPEEEIENIANYYDYLEIQPLGNNEFYLRNGTVASKEELIDINKKIVHIGDKLGKLSVATCDTHFLNEEDEIYRRIIMAGQGFEDADQQAPLYFRTTDEMLKEFEYLDEEKRKEVVITNPNKIADWFETIAPVVSGTYNPVIDGSDEEIERMTYESARNIYGDNLPDIVEARIKKELNSIITNGFSVMYLIAHKLVKKSNSDGYLVGSRGSVGSSFVATMTGITEVNPLPAHYVCTQCKYSEFPNTIVTTGIDMEDKDCPHCNIPMKKNGMDIPFETFLGFKGDKVPDIDLNFSGDYQPVAHAFTEEMFGKSKTFRAGTISTLADKTAYGYVKKYYEEREKNVPGCEINRLAIGCTGIKRTTGQHPGGIIVVPRDKEIYDFTPVQRPADDVKTKTITTHFDFHSIHDNLLKLDILGHDDPTVIRMLEDITGVDPKTIPLDEQKVMSLFKSTEALGVTPEQINSPVGTYAVPEFGTKFVRQMLVDTKPTTFGELVRISGLSHGTDVWLNNAQTLIEEGIVTLKEAICTRDDIMIYLIQKGMDPGMAFKIMEIVRKGKASKMLTEDLVEEMKKNDVPDWYIDSCFKIKYMFPKAHAAAYVMMAYRIAYFKVYYPEAFYAVYYTVRADNFSTDVMCASKEKVKETIKQYEELPKPTQTEKDVLTILEVVNEMLERGITFLPVDIYESDATKFTVSENSVRPPLSALTGFGTVNAVNLVKEREKGPFASKEELMLRAKLGKSAMEILENNNCLKDMPNSMQMNLFD